MANDSNLPEPWLRGPLPGIPSLLQPAAHAFLMAREDVDTAVAGLTSGELWLRPGGIAAVGFHLAHLAGSTDRLLTYARGEALSEAQRDVLARERTLNDVRPSLDQLLESWHTAVDNALEQLSRTRDETVAQPRLVGRAQLPSTVLGLLFHAAEHAARHTGQIVTTSKLVRVIARREIDRIADELRRVYDGDAWYGPSVRSALDGVDARMASTRYVPGGHTIAEIVAHVTAWTEEVTRRVRLGVAQEPEQGDWPAVTVIDEAGWATLLAALAAANAELVDAIRALDDIRLEDRIGDVRDRAVGSGVSRYVTLHGLVQHHAYHTGQVSLLKKWGRRE